MATEGSYSSIADSSTPNAGRIYDFLLGGNHNFEIDRLAAKQLLHDVPEMTQWVRLVRWFLGEAILRLVAEGFTRFLDFASGLPTVDHIHQVAPAGTRVVYSDIDPVTVAYAQEIIKDHPNVAFVHGDAAKPESVLELDIVKKLFEKDHKVALGFNGIAWFLPDEQVIHALRTLYDWASPGSKLYLCDINSQSATTASGKLEEFYERVRQPIFSRNEAKIRTILGKWRICDPGIQPLEAWLPVDKRSMEKATQSAGGNLVGMILAKD